VVFTVSPVVFSVSRGVSLVTKRFSDRDGELRDWRDPFSRWEVRFSRSAEGFYGREKRIRGPEPGFWSRKWNSAVRRPLRWNSRGVARAGKSNSRPGKSTLRVKSTMRNSEIEMAGQKRVRGTQKMELAVW